MTLSATFLQTAVEISEGSYSSTNTAKLGGVTYSVTKDATTGLDSITGTFTIPVTVAVDATTGVLSYTAKDSFTYP